MMMIGSSSEGSESGSPRKEVVRLGNKEVHRHYDASGALVGETQYEHGQLNGTTTHWHKNGTIALQIPVTNNIVHGTVKQWACDGRLLGEFHLEMGTGLEMQWYENGQLQAEVHTIDGWPNGRSRFWDEGGSIVAEVYYLQGRKVSRKRYDDACETDQRLPKYEPEPTRAKGQDEPELTREAVLPAAAVIDVDQRDSELQRKLSDGSAEAREWLAASHEDSRTIGEIPTTMGSVEIVDEIYDAGATSVYAVDIDRYPGGFENTGYLVVQLPSTVQMRTKVLGICNGFMRDNGYDHIRDEGQQYVLLSLD